MALKQIYNFSATAISFAFRVAVFVGVLFGFYLLYKLLLEQTFDGSKQLIPLFILWVVSAYVVIPRIHRTLSKYYLPNYFVGRIRSPSGFLSDPINLAILSNEDKLHKAMQASGWVLADRLAANTFISTVYASVFRKSYKSAPVGNMYLFNRKQDFAYEIEVDGSPNKRHHIRFWRTPLGWYLPGGHEADWLAAATYDTGVGIKLATGQIDHFIHENIDDERDFVVEGLEKSGLVKKLQIIKHFTNAYHDKNNGGDRIKTDGSLPFMTL